MSVQVFSMGPEQPWYVPSNEDSSGPRMQGSQLEGKGVYREAEA